MKDDVSAWTKVVGYGLFGLEIVTGVVGGDGWLMVVVEPEVEAR